MDSTQTETVAGETDADVARPMRHAYPLNDELVVYPGMVARCGHVRTADEGTERGDVSGRTLDVCMVCLDIDRRMGGNVR